MRIILACAALAMIAGCDRPAEQAPSATPTNVATEIAALSDGERNGVFIRAIRDADQNCQGVESSRVLGEVGGRSAWAARCQGGEEWVIVPAPSGAAQVFSLDQARAAGLVRTAQ